MRFRVSGRPLRRIAVPVFVVVAVVVAGGAVWAAARSGDPAPTATTRTVTASPTTFRQTVAASGTLQPTNRADLNFEVSGKVTGVSVSEGQHVSKGTTLATVSSASLQAQLAAAKASLSGDQARLTSDLDNDASDTQVAADRAAVTAAQSQVDDAQAALSQATLTSPITGTVASVDLTVGQQVSGSGGSGSGSGSSGSGGSGGAGSGSGSGGSGARAGSGGTTAGSSGASSSSSSSSGSAQVVVVDTTHWTVQASVDDTVVGQLKKGLQAVITPNGASTPVYGLVNTVGMLPSSSSGTASYPVTIAVTGTPSGLLPGASAQVSIVVKVLSDVLAVPASAVHYSSTGTTVTVVRDGKHSAQKVTVGEVDAGQVQITSGLKSGDQVEVTMPARGSGTNGSGDAANGGNGRTGFGGFGQGGGNGGFRGGGFGGRRGGGQGGGGFGGQGQGGGAPAGGGAGQ